MLGRAHDEKRDNTLMRGITQAKEACSIMSDEMKESPQSESCVENTRKEGQEAQEQETKTPFELQLTTVSGELSPELLEALTSREKLYALLEGDDPPRGMEGWPQ